MNPLNDFQSFMSNPMQFMAQRKLNIPQQYMNDPNGAIQYLMNSGRITQDQYNRAVNMSNRLQKDPNFMKMLDQFKK
jgi:hypothetical protein